jgi:hypothetical protein
VTGHRMTPDCKEIEEAFAGAYSFAVYKAMKK